MGQQTEGTTSGRDDFYRVEQQGGAWLCIKGDDFYSAADYDTEEEAQDAADELNGRWYADGRPANAAARAIAGPLT